MKKYRNVGLVFCLAFLLAIVGCGNTGSGSAEGTTVGDGEGSSSATALQEVNPIPEDGVITKAQFETVAGQDMTIRFEGSTEDGIEYVWIYDCAQIQNPQDQNLLIEFETEGLDSVKEAADDANDAIKMTMTKQGLICIPSLQVKLPGIWESDSCLLVKEQNEELARMSDVTIYTDMDEGGEGTTYLTMSVTALDGVCYVVGGVTEGMTAAAETEAESDGEEVSGDDASDGTDETGEAGSSDENVTGTSDSSDGASDSGSSSSSSSGSNSTGGSSSGNNSSGNSSTGGSASSDKNSSETANTCTISINCATILDNMDKLTKSKRDFVPSDGWILSPTEVEFNEGDSVHDVLQQVCKDYGIHMESSYTPVYNSAFVEGINQLYEFDCGELSGWTFSVNGWFPNYSCSKCTVSSGDEICWLYTCDLGADVGSNVGN